jgi:PEP-CTERM motif
MRKFLLLAVVLLGAVSAYAGPVEFEFLGFTDGNWQLGYPYYITGGPAGSVMAVMCDDYLHGGSVGMTWQANITDLGTNNVSLTRFGHMESALGLAYYHEAGWILLETISTPMGQWMDMNEAVWHIFDPNSPIDAGGLAWLAAAQSEAKLGYPGVDFNRVYIITPVDQYNPDPSSIQEFMYIGNDPSSSSGGASQTPEPGTLLLLGTGTLAFLRRKFLS